MVWETNKVSLPVSWDTALSGGGTRRKNPGGVYQSNRIEEIR